MRLRSAALAAILFAFFFASAVPGASAARMTHSLRFATAEDVAGLNPELNNQLVVTYLAQMTAAFAFRLDHANRLVPELATAIPSERNGGISADGKTITLHLRRSVRWSDGRPFDADDVAFTIRAINNPANDIVSRSGFDQIVTIKEPDKFTLVVRLRAPFGAIVPTLFASSGGLSILPEHLLGGLHDINNAPFNALPVGIGPFRYKAWKRGDQIELERNPYYWRGRPALDRVIMKLIPDRNTVLTQLQTGELEMWYPFGGSYLSRVQSIHDVRVLRQPSYAINQILLNVSGPVLSDRRVREALRDAVDRRTLRKKVGHGVGLLQNVVVPYVDPSTPKDIPFTAFDIAEANAILDRAGWQRGADGVRVKNGTRLSIAFVSSTGTPDVDTDIELIRSWWSQIGVQLDVRRYRAEVLFGPYSSGGILNNGRFDAMFLGLTTTTPFNISLAFGCKSVPPAGQNYSRYCSRAFDAIAARYDATYNDAVRDSLLSHALHLIDRDTPIIVTFGREDLFAVNSSVKNFTPNSATPFDDMLKVDVSGQ